MTTRSVDLLDTAIGNVKNARDHLRHDTEIEPADLSGVIGTARELIWTIDTITTVLIDAYGRQQDLGHDSPNIDPSEAVARIVERLGHARLLDGIDGSFGAAHNVAAKLHRR